ncbi:MAG TPA: hypothetical protein VI565_05305, partial [Burkholderiales bacterium]|nr:hypothetical protein [Burkholderiales bacterium]
MRVVFVAVAAAFFAQPTLVRPQERGAQVSIAQIRPPVAARQPVSKTIHGIVRVDDYDWLRAENWRDVLQDPSTLAPEIRAHIVAENAYADAILAPLARLRAQLLNELKGRVDKDDSTVPFPDGPFVYWQRFQPGAEHPQLMRAPRSGGPEQVLADGAVLAAGKPYFSFGDYSHSPDHRLFAFAADETGSESKIIRVRDIVSGRDLPDV